MAIEKELLDQLLDGRDEFHLAATIQNLRRLVKLTTIPPPRPLFA